MSTLVGLPMPQPGETITEGVVVRWIKNVGDVVAEKEPVVELETAKAVYEYESPLAGKITKIMTQAGEEQKVGRPLALMECDDAAAKKYLRLGVAIPLDASGVAIIGEAKIGATTGASAMAATAGASASGANVGSGATSGAATTGGQFLPPLIRTLAKEQGIPEHELANLKGTGPENKLTKEDVLTYAKTRAASGGAPAICSTASAKAPARGSVDLPTMLPGSTRTESAPIRRRIAENMVLSKTTIPHAGTAVDIDLTDAMAFRESTKAAFEAKHGAKLRLAAYFLFAVREGLKKYPTCNNFYFIDPCGKHWIEEHPFVHLGVAVGTERGLVVPALKNAQTLDFPSIAKMSDALIQKAIQNKLTPDDLTGATITVNNPGALGSVRGNQVLLYPQSAILGFQAAVERACFVDGKCVPRFIMELCMSFDHRLIDGVESVGLLTAIKTILEHPAQYFAV